MAETSGFCRVSEGIVSREVNNGTVILKLATAAYYGLDESATILWNALAETCGTDDLAALLRSEFQIAEEVAVRDVKTFVEGLLAEGLIETKTSGAAPISARSVGIIAERSASSYSPPVLERGLLRNAAHLNMGVHPDGGHTPGGTTQYTIS